MYRKFIFILLFSLGLTSFAHAQDEISENEQDFLQWRQSFEPQARAAGISEATIENALRKAKFTIRSIELDRKQPYKSRTFDEYLKLVIPESRITRARHLRQENQILLDEISQKYGVQPRFIVSLWGIESDFGRNMGSFSIIDSLATMAYEGRRRDFFSKELIHALTIIDQGHSSYETMKGSWAGAMGQTQFMPSSFIGLAVDHDGDGKRDIWNSKADVFASIANYLAQTGWDDNTTWGREIRVPRHFNTQMIGKKVTKNLQEWQHLGVRQLNGANLPGRTDLQASLIRPEEDKPRTFMVYQNYKTLLRWNRSLYFATAVGMLSDTLR